MKPQHTAGPWTVKLGEEYIIEGANDTVLIIGDERRLIPNREDACLITAAPEMLCALIKLVNSLVSELSLNMESLEAIELSKKAIAKAEGKTK